MSEDMIKFLNGEVLKAEANNRRLQRNLDLLCAAIADESLSRGAMQTIARMLGREPPRPTPEIMEWAKKVVERARGAIRVREQIT